MNKGEIYLLNIPASNGHEQTGFRPAIILSEEVSNMIIIAPLTSKDEAKNYKFTLEINPSKENNLDKKSTALIFHLKSIDKKRIKNKLGEIEIPILNEIDNQIKEMLNLK